MLAICLRYFQEVLGSSQLPADINEIQLLKDGSWSVHNNQTDASCLDTPRKSSTKVEVISDDIGTYSKHRHRHQQFSIL